MTGTRWPLWMTRLGWLVLLWLGGVGVVGLLATLIRLWLKA